jgi:anti-anti-sigma factor
MSVRRQGRAVVARPRGEVDAYTLLTWQRLLDELTESVEPPGPVIIDTGSLEFIGCRAVAVLAEQAARCRAHGVRLCLVGGQPTVVRILDATGLHSSISIYPSVDSAVGAAAWPPDIRTATCGTGRRPRPLSR